MDTSQMLWGVFFSSVGFGYFLYGKKPKALVPLLSGMVLMVVSYFISNTIALVVTGVALGTVPFFLKV